MDRNTSHRASGLTRRELLLRSANGFGAVALAALMGDSAYGRRLLIRPDGDRPPHHPARVRNVIFLYMDGGPSQVDTFDPKPRLDREHGEPFRMKMEPTQFNDVGRTLRSPWKFARHGESGIAISELFPYVAKHADRLCVIRSMVSEFSEHTNANYFLHTGLGLAGRPSMGAWLTYGLGSENQDLPGFVVLNGGLIPPGGLDCFSNGFLPATFQGSVFRAGSPAVANIEPLEKEQRLQRNKLALLAKIDQSALGRLGKLDALESSIANYELAFRMQAAVPELMDLTGETEATVDRYGLASTFEPTRTFGRQCLLARRMVERGVRFVELTCPHVPGADRWDQHGRLQQDHANNARAVDQGIGALLEDVHGSGLGEHTLIVFAGEFGRTPFAQGQDGRDHNPFGFSIWLSGAGIKPGFVYGATDEYGYHAVEDRVEIYDLHATMLHLMGIDHKRLTVRHGGRDMRITDVHGNVVHAILV